MIARTGFDITVAGADQAVRQFNAVAAAEKRAGDEGVKAGKGIDAATGSGASGFKAMGNAVDAFLKPLRIAANIIPGLGISGIFLAGYEAVKALGTELADVFGVESDAVKGMGLLTQATRAYEDELGRVQRKLQDVATAQVAVGRNALAGVAGVSAQGITSGVLAAQFGSQSAALDARRKLLDERAAQIAADERALQERAARYAGLPAGTAALPSLEAEVLSAAREIGKRKAAFRQDETKLHDEIVDFRRSVRAAAGDFGPDTAKGGARGAAKGPKDVSEDEIYSVIYGGKAGPAYKQPVPTSDYSAAGNLGRASQDIVPPELRPDAQQKWADKFTDIWQTQIPSAVDFGATAIQQASDAIGGAFTDMIIGGDRVKGGIGRMFGEILAGQSKMLFGLALTAEFLAAAAAIIQIPIFGYTAPQAAGAGAIFAAGGAALALAARALGAGSTPGGSHAGGAGGGGGGGGAYLHNPYRDNGQSATHVTVVIGGEVVTRGVTTETRRIERRGGITEPRMARAGYGAA